MYTLNLNAFLAPIVIFKAPEEALISGEKHIMREIVLDIGEIIM